MKKQSAIDWVHELELEPHVEGGYFREIYESKQLLKEDSEEERKLYTSIYFLLEYLNPSHFHRLTVDEIWYYHAGEPLTIHMIHPNGRYETVEMWINLQGAACLQYRVHAREILDSSV